jgi:hypothetical protein
VSKAIHQTITNDHCCLNVVQFLYAI